MFLASNFNMWRNYDSFLSKKSYMKAVWRAIDANYDA